VDATRRLLDIAEIEALKARYFRLVDAKQWDEWAELFIPDAVTDFSALDPSLVFRDRAGMVAATAGPVGRIVRTIHHGHTPDIEIVSPTAATGTWAMCSWRAWPEGREIPADFMPADFMEVQRWGTYHDEFVKTDAGWKISVLKLISHHVVRTQPKR
jgi:hypothetical protein